MAVKPKLAFMVAPEKTKEFLEDIKTMPSAKEVVNKMNELFKKAGINNGNK